ncbi:MAG: Acetyl-CoA carboxylase carboxyl transferase subunit beta [Frankiales bacterium]|nr:Acetyl-CoA carboxylase carboxyl transferase subunit beta [Frankiales bacterium]
MGEYAPVTTDWREPLLAGASVLDVRLARRNPGQWPNYHPEPSVRAYRLRGTPTNPGPVAVLWDFTVQGGSFGEDDATVFVAAVRHAVRERVPLVTLVRSGGTRLQEGMAALVGIPRARIALLALAEAGLPHLSVADAPTTGGVWIAVVAGADVRVAVTGATVGFAGPRVVEAFTGSLPGPDSHTAESAHAAGLVDCVLPKTEVAAWLAATVGTLTGTASPVAAPPVREPSRTTGWEQVLRARARTVGGRQLLDKLLTDRVPLQARYGDTTVAATLGRLDGRPVVGVAVAAEVDGRPTPDGFRLAARAYRLASRLGLPVISLVDTPGADPGPASERDGIAPAMGEALDALLTCASPTVALVHGEGGSGGALAAAAADTVLVTDEAYFAAIGPEGAAAALRRPKQECADRMRITPADLLALGFADALVTPDAVSSHLGRLAAMPEEIRREKRLIRWSGPVPGTI